MNAKAGLGLIREAARAAAEGDAEAFADTHTDDIEVWSNGVLVAKGRDELINHLHRFRRAFPGLLMQPTELIADDTRIFFDAVMRGRHDGVFRDFDGSLVEPTGRSFELNVAVHFILRDHKIARTNEFINIGELRRQLGA